MLSQRRVPVEDTISTLEPSPNLNECSDMSEGASVIALVLPKIFTSRLGKVPYLRSFSTPLSRSSSADITPARTPPPVYTRRAGSESFYSATPPEDNDEESESALPILPRRRSFSSTISVPECSTAVKFEDGSGVNWKYASQGLLFLNSATKATITLESPSDGQLVRQLYLHSLSYLLRALPSDMSCEEAAMIRNSLPPSMGYLVPSSTILTLPQSRPEPSGLHRFVSTMTSLALLLISIILPYVKVFVAWLYRVERERRISERAVGVGIRALEGSMALGKRVASMKEGKVGEAAKDLLIWWAVGVAGGVEEGVREGIRRWEQSEGSILEGDQPQTPLKLPVESIL